MARPRLLVRRALLVAVAVTCARAEVCTFKDGSSGVTTIAELRLRPEEAEQVRQHLVDNAALPSSQTSGGVEAVLFDTPTSGIDDAKTVAAQTLGSSDEPVSQSVTDFSLCQPYRAAFCLKAGRPNVEYEINWSGTCLGGTRDMTATACVDAELRNTSRADADDPELIAGQFKCVVEDPIEEGPEVGRRGMSAAR